MGLVADPKRFDIWLVSLDPTKGSEIRKTRPCVVVSPDEMNSFLRTLLIAPMTTAQRPYPSRVSIEFEGKSGQIALDQIRCVDGSRLLRHLGVLPITMARRLSATAVRMFAYD
jgi:mRNA interferase MazF